MRAKHQPIRTCIACREARAKRDLVRVVRSPEGLVDVDLSGKANGRGAYLCADSTCWEKAIKRRILGHALKTELDADTVQRLMEHAAKFESHTMNN